MAPSSAFSEETRPGATLASVRAGPTGGASFSAPHRRSLPLGVSPLTTLKPGHCHPQSPAALVFSVSHALPGFPSHKSDLLTRSLCCEVLRVRAPVGPSCRGLSGLQTFLRSKSGGRYINPLFEAAAPAFFGDPGLLPTPQPGALSDPAFYSLTHQNISKNIQAC